MLPFKCETSISSQIVSLDVVGPVVNPRAAENTNHESQATGLHLKSPATFSGFAARTGVYGLLTVAQHD